MLSVLIVALGCGADDPTAGAGAHPDARATIDAFVPDVPGGDAVGAAETSATDASSTELTCTPRSCDDLDPCNGVETCDPTLGCQPGAPYSCDDGDPCNGEEICIVEPVLIITGSTDPDDHCQSTPAPICDDGDPCTVDTCEPDVGCSHEAAPCPEAP